MQEVKFVKPYRHQVDPLTQTQYLTDGPTGGVYNVKNEVAEAAQAAGVLEESDGDGAAEGSSDSDADGAQE